MNASWLRACEILFGCSLYHIGSPVLVHCAGVFMQPESYAPPGFNFRCQFIIHLLFELSYAALQLLIGTGQFAL